MTRFESVWLPDNLGKAISPTGPLKCLQSAHKFLADHPCIGPKLKDYDGEELDGTFYEQELQRVIKSDNLYQIERVVRTRKIGGKKEYFVKWMGYPDKFNSWVTNIHKL